VKVQDRVCCLITHSLYYKKDFFMFQAQHTAYFLHPIANKQLTGESWIAAYMVACFLSIIYDIK